MYLPSIRDVDQAIAAGLRLTEEDARLDLASERNGPAPDAWWAARWGWAPGDVHDLRTTDWRTRPPLPFPPDLRARRDAERRARRRR